MRIAFVGKGGAGKSTFSTLFFLNLIKQNEKVMCFDADLSIHVPKLLGMDFPESKSLSSSENTKKIRNYLIGKSKKIQTADHFYKTTPPSVGVNLFEVDSQNEIIKVLAEPYKNSFVAVVGTYEADEIGKSCYHTNLSILENLLTFAKLNEDDWIVTDMVAGIDAFSNTLHKQFDVLFLIVEPTQESIAVYDQYIKLAKHAGMDDRLFVIGNKIEDDEDEKFIASNIPADKYVGSLKKSPELKKLRQQGTPLTIDVLTSLDESLFERLVEISKRLKKNPNDRLKDLYQLHLKYIDQDYVKNAVGDISGQIDEEFQF
ncbi:MAG: Iron-sulfur cluster carrier protein [candidate division WS2 bacterium]|nr:Iron-sulfur cluster carrier protein [Candidatus Lithacetigena glycinireducens]MBT9175162.1 Iron-sulfur cluster carrier protein [Candidatus Lithacetigena glycinireducens]